MEIATDTLILRVLNCDFRLDYSFFFNNIQNYEQIYNKNVEVKKLDHFNPL